MGSFRVAAFVARLSFVRPCKGGEHSGELSHELLPIPSSSPPPWRRPWWQKKSPLSCRVIPLTPRLWPPLTCTRVRMNKPHTQILVHCHHACREIGFVHALDEWSVVHLSRNSYMTSAQLFGGRKAIGAGGVVARLLSYRFHYRQIALSNRFDHDALPICACRLFQSQWDNRCCEECVR